MFKFDLQPNEKVLNLYRQSESVLFKPVLVIFALIYFPWYFLIKYELFTTYAKLIVLWTLVVFFYGLTKYLTWLLNVYLVTDKRVAVISYNGIFSKKVLEAPLKAVQNAGFETAGFFQSLLGMGNVELRVAGLPEPLILKNVNQPSQVKDFVWNAISGRY